MLSTKVSIRDLERLSSFNCQHEVSCDKAHRGALCNSCYAKAIGDKYLKEYYVNKIFKHLTEGTT